MKNQIHIFTTPILEGIPIREYKGLVTAKNVRGMNIIRDFFTSFRDIFGGRSKSYQDVMIEMEQEVMQEICQEATKLGANAIIGFDIDYDNIGSKKTSLLMVFAKGTAVII